MARAFSREDARQFYDRFGAKQDNQGHYEDAPLTAMIERGRFSEAQSVLELGCGTGRLADRLLRDYLPSSAHYVGIDISATMVGLATTRVRDWGARATILQSDGAFNFDALPAPFDRVIAAYVFDLFDAIQITEALTAMRAVTEPGGLLCLAGLTKGRGPISGFTSGFWTLARRLKPGLVGGCRPQQLRSYLSPSDWRLRHHQVVVSAGVPSEVLIAEAVWLDSFSQSLLAEPI